MVCAVTSGAIFKTRSLTIVPALCIPHRKAGVREVEGRFGWLKLRKRAGNDHRDAPGFGWGRFCAFRRTPCPGRMPIANAKVWDPSQAASAGDPPSGTPAQCAKQYAPIHRTGAQGVCSVEGEPAPLQNFQYSAMASLSQRSFLGSFRTAAQDRAGLPVKCFP